MELQHSKVRRGGVTARYWYGSTQNVYCAADNEGLRFTFNIPSKGGGHTAVELRVGSKDLRAILLETAQALPKQAAMFTEVAHLAVSRLTKRRRKHDGA